MTPSQRDRWMRYAYSYLMNHRLPNAEIVRLADLDLAGIAHPPQPRDIDARCQPEKARPEGYR